MVFAESISARRFRFSLRTLLIATALVAVVIALVLAYRQTNENEFLRQENGRLRGKLGELKIEPGTEDRLQVLIVPTVEDMTWKWHVHVPPRKNFYLASHMGKHIAAHGIPEQIEGMGLNPGEHLVTVAFRLNAKNEWELLVQNRSDAAASGGVSTGLPAKDAKPLIEHHITYSECAGEGSISSTDPGKPLQLLRYRVFSTPPSHQSQDDPTDGILVWICEGQPSH